MTKSVDGETLSQVYWKKEFQEARIDLIVYNEQKA